MVRVKYLIAILTNFRATSKEMLISRHWVCNLCQMENTHVQTVVPYSFLGTFFNFRLFNIFNKALQVFNKAPLRDPNFPNTDVHDGYII